MKKFLIGFVSVFVLVFAMSAMVAYLWSFYSHGTGVIDCGNSVRNAVTFAIIIPSVMTFGRKKGMNMITKSSH